MQLHLINRSVFRERRQCIFPSESRNWPLRPQRFIVHYIESEKWLRDLLHIQCPDNIHLVHVLHEASVRKVYQGKSIILLLPYSPFYIGSVFFVSVCMCVEGVTRLNAHIADARKDRSPQVATIKRRCKTVLARRHFGDSSDWRSFLKFRSLIDSSIASNIRGWNAGDNAFFYVSPVAIGASHVTCYTQTESTTLLSVVFQYVTLRKTDT